MIIAKPIKTLFLDVGGVLLSDGWDRHARERAATKFKLDHADTEDRHHLTFETFESGKITLEEYLERVVFYRDRSFTPAQFRRFMFAQSKAFPSMIEMIYKLRAKYALKVVVVSNEARELNLHRIRTFRLDSIVDAFVTSCFVHVRKPDKEIFQLAIDVSQTPVRQIVYVENTPMFVQIAESLGIRSILHVDYSSTREQLTSLGLSFDDGVIREVR